MYTKNFYMFKSDEAISEYEFFNRIHGEAQVKNAGKLSQIFSQPPLK